MSAAHTPGPWTVVDGHYPSFREINGPSFKISIVMSATDLDFSDYIKREADAQLIAAAPELLEALQQVCLAHKFGERLNETVCAAIAKATGSTA